MDFIKQIADVFQKQSILHNYSLCSPMIAQACLETGYGVGKGSEVKVANNNLLGIKFKENRVKSFSYLFNDGGWEVEKGQKTDLDKNTLWYGFDSIEQCAIGYFEFISVSWYDKLRQADNYKDYCYALKECGYATDPNYAEKLIDIIEKHGLDKYDYKENREEKKIMRINLSAGHNPDGMVGCGAIGLLKESTENRLVTNEVIRQLKLLGHEVYDCTCNNGTSVSDILHKIVGKCNEHEVDLDVSIHFNWFYGKANGTEVLVYDLNGKASEYAKKIANEIENIGFDNRGVKKRSDLYFLRNTKAQALLIECCFCDSKEDVSKYDYKEMASAIVKGITGQSVRDIVTENDDSIVDDNEQVIEKTLYRVQVGAYGVKANADAQLQKLKAAGFDGFITKA